MLESLSPQLVFCVCARPARQDHLLPYMADCRHTPDTLFFVAEEDFRLTRVHADLTSKKTAGRRAPEPEVFTGEALEGNLGDTVSLEQIQAEDKPCAAARRRGGRGHLRVSVPGC